MFLKLGQFLAISSITLALLLMSVTSSSVGRRKRSDDGGPLESVVEQLSQQVNSLNAEVAVLKTKTGRLNHSLFFLLRKTFKTNLKTALFPQR